MRLGSIALLCSLSLAACGGSDDPEPARAPTSTTEQSPDAQAQRDALGLPKDVPLTGSGAANPAQAQVIRGWTIALRRGDVSGASALWTVPATVQNATPQLKLRSRGAVRAFNRSLPCGAIVTKSERAKRDFTIVTFRLTDRQGGNCGTGRGNLARTAIRVQDGKIAEWYRLLDDPDAPVPETGDGPTTES